ncbi:MAG TPA: tRNA (adenosine(37)-N6)-threonylcarbamoyltransferase complex dimerization subunit type 1 TsaB [Solirubrobacterales bacterium]|nr:tRNA (adenosine(37)-N6)-threonylcarbamoyltransferase complex dimerization subunit type 1 TsaB [Solirubrobacterales bacterium]
MATVGFDTATDDTSVAAVRGGEIVYESLLGLSEKGGPQHATALLAEIERAANACGGWEAVSSLAVGVGPGSFTGLRVGIATARGIGLSRGLPVAGVCSLDAVGRALGERSEAESSLAVLDARRGEVFAALYSNGGERLWEPAVHAPEELAARIAQLADAPLGGGAGAVKFRAELAKRGVEIPDDTDPVHRIAARHICFLAASGGSDDEAEPAIPIYLRPPDAERWRERDSFPTAK